MSVINFIELLDTNKHGNYTTIQINNESFYLVDFTVLENKKEIFNTMGSEFFQKKVKSFSFNDKKIIIITE